MSELESLTERQAERRRRVILAGVSLASEGGYDAVQMREVASRADVALGTIYHYFSSKDHLLAAALHDWIEQFAHQVEQRPARGGSDRERVLDLLSRFTEAMSADRSLSAAVVTGFVSPSVEIADIQDQLHRSWSTAVGSAFDPHRDDVQRDRIVRVIEHVWFSGLIGWVMGWMPLEQAISELHEAVDLLLPVEPSAPT
ncbi:MAG: TetR family transcriptional regulator [Acidimicrobiia bacterium]|nr:TetR family transcriptional regulator [Acidimicrobiia bacterium]